MSANITINSITWNATPGGNQTCTVRYRACGSMGAWTLVSAAVTVQPSGNIPSPVVITGLDEGVCYEVEFKNNCGGAILVQNITTASGDDNFTFFNKLDIGNITSIRIDGGANILSSPLAPGANFVYTAPNIYGNVHEIKVTVGTLAKGYHLIDSSEIVGGGTYENIASGVEFTAFNASVPAGKSFFIRTANYHVRSNQYSALSGGITGACTIGTPNGSVSRTAAALSDAIHFGATVDVSLTWTPDNGDIVTILHYFMNPSDTSVPVTPFSVSPNPCTSVIGTVLGVTI